MPVERFLAKALAVAALSFSVGATADWVPAYPSGATFQRTEGNWHYFGTAAFGSAGNLVNLGDNLGWDTSDADNDGNYLCRIGGSPGCDADVAVSALASTKDVYLRFDGCISQTAYSYQWVGLHKPDSTYTGLPGGGGIAKTVEIAFMTRWEAPGVIGIRRDNEWIPLSGPNAPALTPRGFCASYLLKQSGNEVFAYVDGTLFYRGPTLRQQGDITAALLASWDGPIVVDRLDFGLTSSLMVSPYSPRAQFEGTQGYWHYFGSVQFDGRNVPTTIGDHYGWDPLDSDGDGNVICTVSGDSACDGDLVVSSIASENDVFLKFDGCISQTSYSYHWVGLHKPEPAFSGVPDSRVGLVQRVELAFMTRWEYPNVIGVRRETEWIPIPESVAPAHGPAGFCGSYFLKQKRDRVYAYVNGALVYEGRAMRQPGELTGAFATSWDGPLTATDLRFGLTADLPDEQLAALIVVIESFNLAQGIENSLDAKIQAAVDALNATHSGAYSAACNAIAAFAHAVSAQSGKHITSQQAVVLLDRAARIQRSLGCT